MTYDYIIIGSGVSGLNAARLIDEDKKVLVLCKKSPWECNTFWAQGGVATAVDKDDIEAHVKDTLEAGVYCNDTEAVENLSKNSRKCIDNLIEAGFEFDRNEKKELAFTKEAAHSRNRILHADGDATGRMLHMFLLQKCQHALLSEAVVVDLLIQDDICYGVVYIENGKQKVAYSNNTIIASGGIGAMYKYHTNATTIAGEIQGICIENNIALKDMEMLQFHPTVLRGTSYARKPLLSEALRGEGAHIVDENGYRFTFEYHEDGELAPRDVVSRAIFDYHNRTKHNIYLSFETFEKESFRKRFPNIYQNLKEHGFELPYERVPISPAFHYTMGGIEIGLDAKVKGMKNLYAIGEAACSGVHGANRLASNSLLEGLVYSQIAVDVSFKDNFKIDLQQYKKNIKKYQLQKEKDKEIKNSLREIMWECAGIVRNTKDLERGLSNIETYLKEEVGRLLYLRLLTAKSILFSALKRKSSIGAHYIKEN